MKYHELVQSFFDKEIKGKQQFPKEIENVYRLVTGDMLKKYPEIRSLKFDLENESPQSVSSQFYKFFPTHYFKAYYSLLQTEQLTFGQQSTLQFIGWPGSTLVDIGCGSGSVSVAYLAILLKFQQFLISHGKTISPIKVCLVGIDTNDNMLVIYAEMIERISSLLQPYLIRVNFKTIVGSFPNKIDEIFGVIEPIHRHYVLLALSNIVRPLDEMYDRSDTVSSEKIARAIYNEPEEVASFGAAESRAIMAFLEKWELEQVGVLAIATSGKHQRWYDRLNTLSDKITDKLKPENHVSVRKEEENGFIIINPNGSYWKTQKAKSETPIDFSWVYIHVISQNFYCDTQWQELLKYGNLKLAWARTRQYAMREALTDEIELKLFDIDTDLKLMRLRALMLMQKWDKLNIQWLVKYPAPKNIINDRPKTVARIEEQILSVALIQLLGHDLERKNSYSYQLNRHKSEFLYEYWLAAWKTFIADTHKQAVNKKVFRTDIEDFYRSVPQDQLIKATQNALDVKNRTKNLHEFLISRDCGSDHTKGYGIPQGHIASGFWADIYLGIVDDVIEKETISDLLFARYADDMIFAFDAEDENIDNDIEEVKNLLRTLDLNLSESKTLWQSGAEYIESTELDPLLDELSEDKFEPVVNQSMFGLPHEYWMLYQNAPEDFVNDFFEVLRSLSIYMSKSWIHRKLHQNFLNGEKSLKGKTLQWPQTQDFQSNKETWLADFQHLNPTWLNSIAVFKDELSTICLESYKNLKQANITESQRKKFLRRFRFTAHRICILQAPDEIYQILTEELVQAPWTISAKLVCPSLANGNQIESLLKIMKQSSSSYVRAVAADALGTVQYDADNEYVDVVKSDLTALLSTNNGEPHERLKSSESLLRFDQHATLTSNQLVAMINEEKDPYLVKNYILLLGKVDPVFASTFAEEYSIECSDLIVHDAIQILRHDLDQVIQKHFEPFELKEFYSNFYPETEADTDTHGDSP